jgi:hypothetical protein
VLAEELVVFNGEGPLWQTARPLLDAALRLENLDDSAVWHGWRKREINVFLQSLPSPSSLIAGIWETLPATENRPAQDKLVLGVVCKVEQGEIRSFGTWETLVSAGLKSLDTLEIDMNDILEVMHYARRQFAPVAWALFGDRSAWNRWFLSDDEDALLKKADLLRQLVARGRIVLMGSQTATYDSSCQ